MLPAPNTRHTGADDAGAGRLPRRTTGKTLRVPALRAMPLDRPDVAQSAQDRAAVRTLHLRYPIETLAESLAEGISTGHPEMPASELNPDQIHDLLSYLKTSNDRRAARAPLRWDRSGALDS